jgi:hypothetical protein
MKITDCSLNTYHTICTSDGGYYKRYSPTVWFHWIMSDGDYFDWEYINNIKEIENLEDLYKEFLVEFHQGC